MKLNSEQVAFILFLSAISSLLVMAILPGSANQAGSNVTKMTPKKIIPIPESHPEIELQEEENEEITQNTTEEKQPPLPYVFPESDEDWLVLLKKHLWILANSDKPKLVRESKMILSQAPREAVEKIAEPYIQELLNSKNEMDRNSACMGIRYLKIASLANEILEKLPQVQEERSDPSIPFYLIALGAGDKSVSRSLLSYALSSKVAKHRTLALESLALIRDPTVVPPCIQRLRETDQRHLDHSILIEVLVKSIEKQHYPLLIQLFESKQPQHRKEALLLMRQVDLPYFLDYYKKSLEDSNKAIRLSAYRYFTELAEPSCAEYLLARAKNKALPREERIFSLEGASRSGEKLNPREFDSFLQEKDPTLRLIALITQAYLKDNLSIPGLIEMLSVSEEDIFIPQGSDLEEERTWIKEHVETVLTLFTKKEFAEPWQWKQWWKQQQKFQFPSIRYMEKMPKLYIHR